MPQHFILSVISDDKPGIIKTIADAVSTHGGSWLESRLAHLDGKFAGIVRVCVGDEAAPLLTEALMQLKQSGITIQLEPLNVTVKTGSTRTAKFTLAGPDRTGIVRELAHAFAQHNINVEELTTHCSSMPYSGDPLFEASGKLQIPGGEGLEPLLEQLDAIADKLALDIRLEENT